MEQLLGLLTLEKGRELHFRAGEPPVMVLDDEQHPLEGPPITEEELMWLFRSVADSRHMRDLRNHGTVQFVYTIPPRAPFLVHAKMEGETVVFEVS